jgi:hypothetical protein
MMQRKGVIKKIQPEREKLYSAEILREVVYEDIPQSSNEGLATKDFY